MHMFSKYVLYIYIYIYIYSLGPVKPFNLQIIVYSIFLNILKTIYIYIYMYICKDIFRLMYS